MTTLSVRVPPAIMHWVRVEAALDEQSIDVFVLRCLEGELHARSAYRRDLAEQHRRRAEEDSGFPSVVTNWSK